MVCQVSEADGLGSATQRSAVELLVTLLETKGRLQNTIKKKAGIAERVYGVLMKMLLDIEVRADGIDLKHLESSLSGVRAGVDLALSPMVRLGAIEDGFVLFSGRGQSGRLTVRQNCGSDQCRARGLVRRVAQHLNLMLLRLVILLEKVESESF